MKEDKVCKIYIEKAEVDYRYLIEDPSRGTTSFRDRMTIPYPSRNRILKKLKFLGATVGGTKGAKKKNTNRGLEVAKNENIKENIEKMGGLIFKYMIPLSCKDYLSEMDTEYVVLSTDDVEIPWELMHDGTDFYCLKYSIGRKIQARVQFKPTKRQKTDILNALFIANPTEDLPEAEKEVDTIVTNLQEEKIKFQYLKGENATIDSLFEILETEKFDIFHYAGHAGFNIKPPEDSVIRLYDSEITAKYLLNIFEDVPPRLVFMNACESAASKEIEYLEYEGKLTGMATAFISAGVDAYIGTFWPVHDKIASELSIDFYRRILMGEPMGSALKNAKASIFQEYGNFSNTWASFILYGDPRLKLFEPEGISPKLEYVKIDPLLVKIDSLLNLAIIALQKAKFDDGMKYLEQALYMANKMNDPLRKMDVLGYFGVLYELMLKLDSALDKYKESLDLSKQLNDKLMEVITLNRMGSVYRLKNELDRAFENYALSLKFCEQIGHKQGISAVLSNLSIVYLIQGNLEISLEKIKESLQLSEEINDEHGIANVLGNMGVVYYCRGDFDSAFELYKRSLNLSKKIGDEIDIARMRYNIGQIFISKREWDKAIESYSESLKIYKKIRIITAVSAVEKILTCIEGMKEKNEAKEVQDIIPYENNLIRFRNRGIWKGYRWKGYSEREL